jgi:hypothetical protein
LHKIYFFRQPENECAEKRKKIPEDLCKDMIRPRATFSLMKEEMNIFAAFLKVYVSGSVSSTEIFSELYLFSGKKFCMMFRWLTAFILMKRKRVIILWSCLYLQAPGRIESHSVVENGNEKIIITIRYMTMECIRNTKIISRRECLSVLKTEKEVKL